MGMIWESIPFFAEKFAIVPHTATAREHIGRPVTVAEFARKQDVALWVCGDEYHLRTRGYPARHMEGPAVDVSALGNPLEEEV